MDPTTYTLAFSRLAPVQCVTWGHPVTTGIPTVDYFLSSELIEPEWAEEHYTEKLVRLKTLPFYYYRPVPPAPLKSRRDFGLSDEHHLYACLQTLFKFHPEFDEILGGILRRDPRGRLVLIRGKHRHWEDLLTKRWAATIPDVLDRIQWLAPQPRADFLNLMAVSDVLLDTIHFGGGNTSYEGLGLGVPIVTLAAPFMRGRITYALYRKMGVMDCVAASPQQYADSAVALATDPSYREAVRARILAANGALFEDIAAVRELEEFFRSALRSREHLP
jgi:protein O-GlcNAc transferase